MRLVLWKMTSPTSNSRARIHALLHLHLLTRQKDTAILTTESLCSWGPFHQTMLAILITPTATNPSKAMAVAATTVAATTMTTKIMTTTMTTMTMQRRWRWGLRP